MANSTGHLQTIRLMFMFITLLGVTGRLPSPLCPQTFYACKNRALKNFTYRTKTVGSAVICGRDCSADQKCKSFNFYATTSLCELNIVTRYEHQDSFFEQQGSGYFDMRLSHDFPRDCQTILQEGFNSSGVYTIHPEGCRDGIQVFCDMETDGGGWIVFQRRQDGSVDFYRNWAEYQSGFGDLSGEFWLGNDNLARLTADDFQGHWELRVDLEDWNNITAWAKYGDFKISGDNFTLHVDQYDERSTAGNALRYHNGQAFTTRDNDHDMREGRNCADDRDGAWWFDDCDVAHLNGVYVHGGHTGRTVDGILWDKWRGESHSLKTCSMKMRLLTP